jgi:DNA-binding GntR family transcriptional regulator
MIPAMGRRSTAALVTISSSIYERLRREILSGELPPGSKLTIDPLRARYQSGISPIREALNRLSAEGLVDKQDQRGFRVAATSEADLAELVRTRCWLESMALRESMARGDDQWHELLVVLLHRLSRIPRSTSEYGYSENPEWEALHRQFHRAILAPCGSTRLIRYCEDMADQAYRYRQLAVRRSFQSRDTLAEHAELVDAILARDADRAVALLVEHYRRTAAIVRGQEAVEAIGDAA